MAVSNTQLDPGDRFAHILQPIKDLTKNWDIDIAACLEDYLEELEHVAVSFDGGETTMNFAQAAMLLQSSACVYSKKVEYLYSLVNQVLEMLANKKKQAQKSSVDNEGNDEDADFRDQDEDEEFLSLDDLQYGKNVDMKEDFDSREVIVNKNLKAAGDCEEFQLLPQIPLCLIPLEEGEKGENPLLSKKGEVLASRNDFKMNTCCIHPMGTLLLDLSHLALLDAANKIMEKLAENIPAVQINSDLEMRDSHEVGNDPQNMSVDENPGFESMADEVDGALPLAGEEPVPPMESADVQVQGREGLRRSEREKRPVSAPHKQPMVNPWEHLEPHSSTKVDKPLKKGSVHRLCPGIEDNNKKKRKRRKDIQPDKLEPVANYIERACFSNHHKFPKNSLKVPTFPELDQMYWEEYKRRQAMMKEMRKKRVVFEEDNEPEEEVQDLQSPDLDNIGNDDDDDDMQPLVDDNLFNAIEEGMRHHQSFGHDMNNISERVDEGIIVNSYEDLVRKHVEEFMASAQEYAQITELSKRVSEWEEKIVPRLEEEDKHEPFDINTYGSGIIVGLNLRNTVKFHQLVQGKPLYEICRTFLASLMLANTENVRIEEKGSLETGMDRFELELLSTRRHFEELQEYQAPSLTGK